MTPEQELDKIFSERGWSSTLNGFREALLAWHNRWSWRPTREQIERCFMQGSSEDNMVIDRILALYPAPPEPRKVSRDQIRSVLVRYHAYYKGSSQYLDSNLINDLEALLNGEKKVEWCKDIEWHGGAWAIRAVTDQPVWLRGIGSLKVDDWKLCPICSAPRPKGWA